MSLLRAALESRQSMKLYHYSQDFWPELKTRRVSGIASNDEIRKADQSAVQKESHGSYIDHISFFFDPIPAKLLGELFGSEHRAWFKGNELYEYVIDVDSLEAAIPYHVVESLRRTEFMDRFVEEHNWVEDDPVLLKRYLGELKRLEVKWGEFDKGLNHLKAQIKLNEGQTAENYLAASKREDFADGKHRYASNVPHLMLYPSGGIVAWETVNKVVIGSDKRHNVQRTL